MDPKQLCALFGLSPHTISKMDGYGSQNYRVETPEQTYVLKYYTSQEDKALVEAEEAMVLAASSGVNPMLPVSERPLIGAGDGFARLLPYLDGQFLNQVPLSETLLASFGLIIAQLHSSLDQIRNPVIEARRIPWDLKYVLDNEGKLDCISNPKDRVLVDYFLDQFAHLVLPKQAQFTWSIIHNDLNENNVLVSGEEVSGIIDFGDIVYAPKIYDVGIALTYAIMLNPENWEECTRHVLRGYCQLNVLTEIEIDALYYIIAARLCTSVLNSAEAKQQQVDTDYILISEVPAWTMLRYWISLNPIKFTVVAAMASGKPKKDTLSDQVAALRRNHGGASLSLSYEEPIHMIGAAFQYMYAANGDTYLDAYNNIPLVGHCHPQISRAIANQVRTLNTNTRYVYDAFSEYAARLLSHFPPSLNKIYLVNSGSEASDLAIRIARTVTGRQSIAILEHGYHGHTSEGINISSYKFDGKGGGGSSSDVIVLPLPNAYRNGGRSGEDFAHEAIAQLQQAIADGNKPAAFIAEPISGCGGQVPLAPLYLQTLTPFLEQEGILYISDEVQVGFGRLGEWFWGYELHNVEPDIVVIGKPMGNCHPIGGLVTSELISDQFANGMEFFSSFGGNPVSCVVGKTVLDIIEAEQLQANARAVGTYFMQELIKLKSSVEAIGDVRGHGLFIGIELVDSDGAPHPKLAKYLKEGFKANAILVSTDGPYDNVIKSKPPLCFTTENVDRFVNVLEALLDNRD